jgi:hypothetical protein
VPDRVGHLHDTAELGFLVGDGQRIA